MKKWDKLSDHPMSIKHSMNRQQYDKIRDEWINHQWDMWGMFSAGFCIPIVVYAIYFLIKNFK